MLRVSPEFVSQVKPLKKKKKILMGVGGGKKARGEIR